jgi:hypothetical protein
MAYSQITLDFQTSSPYYRCFKLSDSETKFFDYDGIKIKSTHQLLLYNLDGSLFKTIQVPVDPNAEISGIEWISRTLFDNDPSNIEFLACYSTDSSSYIQLRTKVIREDGTILLDELHANIIGYFDISWAPLIYSTESGTKLRLDYSWAGWSTFYQSKVFNLPGTIPSGVTDNPQGFEKVLSLYPNPNNGSFVLKFYSNQSQNNIELYSINGILLDTFKSSEKLIYLNHQELPAGMYILNTQSQRINSSTKMVIKK